MMKTIEGLVDWFLNSSADPTKVSLSVRAVLLFAFGVLVKVTVTGCTIGVACVVVDQGTAMKVIDAIVNITFWACSIVGAVGFLAGVARKVWITLVALLNSLFG